ncbi:MAG: asparagine synthetase A [Candidatus Aminicenantales bacterium]
MFDVDKALTIWRSEVLRRSLRVQATIIDASREFLQRQGFVEILPVIISPITDPLTDYRVRGEVECYGFKYQITKSMIFHKQIALFAHPRIFCFSPNVRVEAVERQNSGKHLIEFVQLDLEVREASREEMMALGEELFRHVVTAVKEKCAEDLSFFGRALTVPESPFVRIAYQEAETKYGPEFEENLSRSRTEPFWVVDFPIEGREFYDREDPNRPGILIDMDLYYPEGYGEALSGGEREYELERICRRIQQKGIQLEAFTLYLEVVKRGLYPSAGFGIGIERLTRYLCGLKQIELTRLFAKLPGQLSL